MTKDLYRKIEAYMHVCAADSAHDTQHIYRVLNHALAIGQTEEQVDYDVLITACLLHDIGRPEQFADPKVCHAQAGAEKAKAFLENLDLAPDFVQAVCHCIRTHRYSNRVSPESLEAKILFDADKLDVTGALGIARTLQFQGKHDLPLYTLLPDGNIAESETAAQRSFFQEYNRKLIKLYDGFLTNEGARLGAQQKVAAEDFYKALYRQVAGNNLDLTQWVSD